MLGAPFHLHPTVASTEGCGLGNLCIPGSSVGSRCPPRGIHISFQMSFPVTISILIKGAKKVSKACSP
eukprot:1268110-Amphidinium_carterae.1